MPVRRAARSVRIVARDEVATKVAATTADAVTMTVRKRMTLQKSKKSI
jgi:hypothetical protein